MAKVKQPLFSQEAVGALGGIQFRRATYGPIVSRTSVAPHLMTPAQTVQRALLPAAHHAFDALTDQQREAWNAFATYPETGRNAYIRAYTILKKIGLSPNPDPRPSSEPGWIDNVVYNLIGAPPNTLNITWDFHGDPNAFIMLYALQTYSGRATPKPAKFIYKIWDTPVNGFTNWTFPMLYPHNWIRLEIRDPANAQLFYSCIYDVRSP